MVPLRIPSNQVSSIVDMRYPLHTGPLHSMITLFALFAMRSAQCKFPPDTSDKGPDIDTRVDTHAFRQGEHTVIQAAATSPVAKNIATNSTHPRIGARRKVRVPG